MKKAILAACAAATAVCLGSGATATAQVGGFSDIQLWYGSGANESALVIDFNDGGAMQSFVWGYRWDGTKSGADMIIEIAAADPRLSITNFGDGSGGFFLSSITYNDGSTIHTQTNGDFADTAGLTDYLSWGYYLAGGFSGDDVNNGVADGNLLAVAGGGSSLPGSWAASQFGASRISFTGDWGRILADGSWDAWSFGQVDGSFEHLAAPGPEQPTSAVPEPSSALLVILGLLVATRHAKRRVHTA